MGVSLLLKLQSINDSLDEPAERCYSGRRVETARVTSMGSSCAHLVCSPFPQLSCHAAYVASGLQVNKADAGAVLQATVLGRCQGLVFILQLLLKATAINVNTMQQYKVLAGGCVPRQL